MECQPVDVGLGDMGGEDGFVVAEVSVTQGVVDNAGKGASVTAQVDDVVIGKGRLG